MFTKFFSTFWAISAVETWAVNKMDELVGLIFRNLFHPKEAIAMFSAVIQLFNFMAFRKSVDPFGAEPELDGYELVLDEEFEGDELNTDIWYYRAVGHTGNYNGYYGPDTVSVKDGNLHIGVKYLENGSLGAGWYGAEVATKQKYTRGYFECRCICSYGKGFWSAFWLQNDKSASKESQGGIYGIELDVCEANAENSDMAQGDDAVLQCLHCNGGTGDTTDDVDTSGAIFFTGNNIYTEYNTYAVKWDEEYYTFYVNGKETLRTSWRDGTCTTPNEVILSVCVPRGNIDKLHPHDFTTDFVVDYVKIYQQKSDIVKVKTDKVARLDNAVETTVAPGKNK